MALFACPECKSPVSDMASSCPKCGRPVRFITTSQPTGLALPSRSGCRNTIIGFFSLFLVIGLVQECAGDVDDPKPSNQQKTIVAVRVVDTIAQKRADSISAYMREGGKRVFNRLKKRHPNLKPSVWGMYSPQILLPVPFKTWNSLTKQERLELVYYMPDFVLSVRGKPSVVLHDWPSDAPAYERIFDAVSKVSKNDWVIMGGSLVGIGKKQTMTIDNAIVCGSKYHDCNGGVFAEDLLKEAQ